MFFVSPRIGSVFLLFLGLTSGHNWVVSQSRSTSASTFRPYKPPTSVYPHVQVGPNQNFTIEWACAHYGYTYFAVVKQENSGNCTLITESLLDDYINLAPNSSIIDASKGYWQKFHRKDSNMTTSERGGNDTSFYLRYVPPGDPLYIQRDPLIRGYGYNYQIQYHPSDVADDSRVSYQSSKYPWLEAVHKFKHISFQAVYPDTAQFVLPGYGGPGRYIIQYLWQGYRDAIDVDYMSTPVQYIYGQPTMSSAWSRIDHCIYPNPVEVYDFSEIVTDVRWCLNRCSAELTCEGVNAVPLVAPSTSFNFSQQPNITYYHPELPGSDIYVQWNTKQLYGKPSVFYNNTEVARLLANATSTKFMCYTLNPRLPSSTRDTYSLTKDPEDPAFYSSCFYPYKGNIFPGYPEVTLTPTTSKGSWKFNDKCISCHDQSYNAYNVIPKWNITTKCIDCDKEPVFVAPPVMPTAVQVEAGFYCDGASGSWRSQTHHNCSSNYTCSIQLSPAGRFKPGGDNRNADTYPDECRELALHNPACSNVFWWNNRTTAYVPATCYCYAKDPCCKSCSRVSLYYSTVSEVTTTPDPTCSKGVLSTDNAFCCSGSCGAGNCKPANPTTATVASSGFCVSNSPTLTRSCSEAGAPCKM